MEGEYNAAFFGEIDTDLAGQNEPIAMWERLLAAAYEVGFAVPKETFIVSSVDWWGIN
jgi:hypothetical protein